MSNDRDEWLQWRHRGIGSSDAPCIHGESPYQTRHDLWETKIQPKYAEKETNYVQRIGNDMETIARIKFAALYNMENGTEETFSPNRLELSGYPFMKASLDGASKDLRIIVEFKFQSKPDGGKMTPGKQAHLDVLQGKVRRDYWIQVQHQLLISGAEFAYFVSYDGVTLNSCKIHPDVEFMGKHLEACAEFWGLVVTKKPPALTADDYKELRVKGAKAKVQEWKRVQLAIEALETAQEELREEILKMAEGDHPRMTCDGVRIVKYSGSQGSIDYKKYADALGATPQELEQYRKPQGKPFWKMEMIK